jgi:folate-binding protein YgfZ
MASPVTDAALGETLRASGAAYAAGASAPSHFGDPAAELQALSTSAGLVDRTSATRFEHKGKDALDLLHRLTTNDLLSLGQGRAAGTVLTSDKGRVIDALTVAVLAADSLLLLSESEDGGPAAEWIDRYTIIEDAAITDISPRTAQFAVIGPGAVKVLQTAAGVSLEDGSALTAELAGAKCEVVRLDWPGLPRIDVVCSLDDASQVWGSLRNSGAAPAGDHAFHTARVMHGIPFPGNELSDRVNPLEAGLGRFISFTKGCYIGQEVIARLDSYDKLQRRLARLAANGDLQPGDALTASGKKAGEVTSVAPLTTGRERLALGMVRRGSWEPGTELRCGDVKVSVQALARAG